MLARTTVAACTKPMCVAVLIVVCLYRLEITQPPLFMCGLIIRIPFTWKV